MSDQEAEPERLPISSLKRRRRDLALRLAKSSKASLSSHVQELAALQQAIAALEAVDEELQEEENAAAPSIFSDHFADFWPAG